MMNFRQPFASIAKTALILLLLLSFVLITQQSSKAIYQIGMLLLIIFTLLQIAFGNIPSSANFKQTLLYLGIAAVIIGGLVFFSIAIAPTMIRLGR
ncbi:MAG: hypothetical protein K8I60_20390 [Anaerolineae bacterium]|nr:hypothetical protein [Anaerolineae bacterium]